MHTEAEMISLIKDIAFKEENIRAAYIEGSRTNPNAPKDIFQDYDIVYIVTTTKPFREDKEWINNFGKILYMHYPQETMDERYWFKEPREIEFQCTCSDFWWCLNNVAKGLWRNELPYAIDVINFVLRPHLKRLLEWKIGIENNFSVSAGKSGKYFKKYLPKERYRQFLATYSIAEICIRF